MIPFRVRRSDLAAEQYRFLAPSPKREVKAALRELGEDPYGPGVLQLDAEDETFRIRAGDYRILFRPGPGHRELTVFRIAPREVAYEGFEHPASRD